MNYLKTKMEKFATHAQVLGLALALTVLTVIDARGQERIFSMEQVKAEPAGQTEAAPRVGAATMAAGRMTQQAEQQDAGDAVLDNRKIQEFNDLYFSVQPALYYDQDETLDVRNGELPTVITVHPAAFQRLQGDLQNSRYDFSMVKLIVVKDVRAGGGLRKFLLDTSEGNFPSLDYVVVANNKDTGEMNENMVHSMTQAVDADAESLAHLIFVYDNLTENN